MKGLNKIALVAAIAAASTAQAELVAMDDAAMSAATGQAGLTIDVNAANITIGEIAYQDEGFIGINDLTLAGAVDATGAATAALTDIRMTVDVAGGATADGAPALGGAYLSLPAGAVGDVPVTLEDGDLVIALRSQSGAPINYGLSISSVNLAASTAEIGNIDASGTTLVSDLALNGILGPIDIVIDNGDGGMNISAFFTTQGQLNLPFISTSLGLAVGNLRGDLAGAMPFAHVQMNIASAGDAGLAFDLQNFSADIDMTDITLGAAPSIGSLYITDMRVTAETIVYGH